MKIAGAWRRLGGLLDRWRSPAATLFYHPAYEIRLPLALLDARRGRRIATFLAKEALLRRGQLVRPARAALRDLRRVHTDVYLESLGSPAGLERILGFQPTDDQQDGFLAAQRAMTGGTVAAARLAARGTMLTVNLGGGLHHAFADHGHGFCAFNDIAVAVAVLRSRGFADPILVVDLDLHDGDGTRELLAGDAAAHLLSIHNDHMSETATDRATLVALGEGVDDDTYLAEVRRRVPAAADRCRPRLVFYLAGCDPAEDDRLGNWAVTGDGLLQRDLYVASLFRERGVPVVLLLAGGYGRSAWRHGARSLSALLNGGRALEPPREEDLILRRHRRIARVLQDVDLTREPGDADWSLSESDLSGDLAGQEGTRRFLGYYSRHGIELAMERFGFLDRLRERGFRALRLELSFGDPVGHLLRVRDASAPEPVLELRARRDGASLPGFELLRVEWLLLQDPRADFPPGRPPLPGQTRPGLGLLTEVMAMLVMVCERLGLDGLIFTPSHYHVAAHSRHLPRFLEPAAEARFRAIQEAVRGLGRARATRALEAGLLEDADGKTVRWEPSPMVLPLSDALRAELEGEAFEAQVQAAGRGLAYRLRRRPPAGE